MLDGLDSASRMFLLRTSVLDRLSGELCDHMLAVRGSSARLARLERSNLFLTALDDDARWFRYHELFRDLLRAQLEPASAAALRRRAAGWFREAGLIDEAVEYARAAGDDEEVAALLDRHHMPLARQGRAASIVHWTAALPEWRLVERPGLIVGATLAAGAQTRPEPEIRRLLAIAARSRELQPDAWQRDHDAALAMVEALYAVSDVSRATSFAVTAVEAARGGELAAAALSILANALLLAGDDRGAERSAQEAVVESARFARPYASANALGTLAILELRRGRTAAARAHADAALGVVATLPGGRSVVKAGFVDALVARREGRLAHAERALARAIELRLGLVGPLEAWMHVELAEVRAARGRVGTALEALAAADEILAGCADAGMVTALARSCAVAIDAVRRGAPHPAEAPSPAERAVLELLPAQLSTRQIADTLFLSPNTVRSHIRALYRKLGVHTREDAVDRAQALGLLDSPG